MPLLSSERPPRREPDELASKGSAPDASRDTIWKSVPNATGGFGCERATFYKETVRGPDGRRLSFPADERILFGIAVDEAHNLVMKERMSDGPLDTSVVGIAFGTDDTPILPESVEALRERAVQRGWEVARGRDLDHPWTDEEWATFRERLTTAVDKLLGLWPNYTAPNPPADVLPPGPPAGWLDFPGVVVDPQRRLYAPHAAGRGVSGRPDYVFLRDGVIVGWIDVKALGRSPTYPARWATGDTVTYDFMCAVENEGVLPLWHGYLEYRRLIKPYWALVRAPVRPGSLALARAYFTRWQKALDAGDPDVVSFNVKACGTCEWREPIEGLHAGCPIGPASVEVAPAADPES